MINSSGGQCLLMRSPDAVIYLWHCPPYITIYQYPSSVPFTCYIKK
ncbi:hypothetical protein [Moorena producens]|nr:hypothetical protein [Moorena producens]